MARTRTTDVEPTDLFGAGVERVVEGTRKINPGLGLAGALAFLGLVPTLMYAVPFVSVPTLLPVVGTPVGLLSAVLVHIYNYRSRKKLLELELERIHGYIRLILERYLGDGEAVPEDKVDFAIQRVIRPLLGERSSGFEIPATGE